MADDNVQHSIIVKINRPDWSPPPFIVTGSRVMGKRDSARTKKTRHSTIIAIARIQIDMQVLVDVAGAAESNRTAGCRIKQVQLAVPV